MRKTLDTKKISRNIAMIVILVLTIYAFYMNKKIEDAKYIYNRNCYYRLESIKIKTDEIIKKLFVIQGQQKASKNAVTEIMYLHKAVSNEQAYLRLSIDDYRWKLGEIKEPYEQQVFWGILLDVYYNYININYEDDAFVDYGKEREKINLLLTYYIGIRDILKEKAETVMNDGQLYKQKIIGEGQWVYLTSELNKHDTNFSNMHREKFAEESKGIK